MTATRETLFWIKVDKNGPISPQDGTRCWLWTGALATSRKGDDYGNFWDGTKVMGAHRYSYELVNGTIPKGLQVDHRHTCPKRCVNHAHMRLVTNKQNKENLPGAYVGNRSGVRGVTWNKQKQKWRANVRHDYRLYYLGDFATIEEAEAVVIAKRLELHTHNDADRTS